MISDINMVKDEESPELQKTDPKIETDLVSEVALSESFPAEELTKSISTELV